MKTDKFDFTKRVHRILMDIPKLQHTLLALESELYVKNYEELSLEATVMAEKLACSIRNLIYTYDLMPRQELMRKVSKVQGIRFEYKDGIMSIFLPGLLPKKKKGTRTYITDPLYYSLEQYVRMNEMERFGECVICFCHVYDVSGSKGRVRDYDNEERKHILDTINALLLTDDSPQLIDTYLSCQDGKEDCTIVCIMDKKTFKSWIKEDACRKNTMSHL